MRDPLRQAGDGAADEAAASSARATETCSDVENPSERERVYAVALWVVTHLRRPLVVWAASRGLADVVRYLIIVEPDHVWRYGAEALWGAHEHGHTESVRLLEDFFGIN